MANNVTSEILLDCAQSIFGAIDAAREAFVQKENFKKYSTFLEAIAFFLQDLSKFEVKNLEHFNTAIGNLKLEIKAAKHLVAECSQRNKIYLFLSCNRIANDMENSTNSIARAMSSFSSETPEIPSEIKDGISRLCKNMEDARYDAPALEEEILQKIETGIEERNLDRSFASNLLVSIADVIGISTEQRQIKTEFENFKDEMARTESRTEDLRMERIILLLGSADIVTTPKEKKIKYFTTRNSLGRKLLEPLQSFYCPITGEVMVDPVETQSGQTFEREAIEKWLDEGSTICPLTKTFLCKNSLRPNRTLSQSIEEWKKRNTMISIASMKLGIESSDEKEVINCLDKLHDYCAISEMYREWIVMEDYIPILIGLLSEKSNELRVRALAILNCLAKDGDDNKEKIANVTDGIKYIVRSLARKIEESLLALQLLLELSKSTSVRNVIGGEHGCILLLVTLASSDEVQASEYALGVLDNLSIVDQNVIQMARTKFFRPLLQCLREGPITIKMIMADTLSHIELTDHNKLCLSRDGALKPLLEMLRNSDLEVKSIAVGALENLSGVAQNGIQLIKEGAKDLLFELLFCHNLSAPKLRENVANMIMHLAISTASLEASEDRISLVESEEDVFKLFSLVSLTGPDVQRTLLATFHALCKSPSGLGIRTNLRQISAVQVLVQLCEHDDLIVRANAVKLFHYLIEDGDHPTFSEHVNKKCIATLITIIKTSDNEEEIASSIGIISCLPHDTEISQNLLQTEALEVIFDCLTSRKKEIVENATFALSQFTIPSNIEWQKRVAEKGTIPILVKLLESGSSRTKRNVALSLKQLSENSRNLTFRDKKVRFVRIFCFASHETTCPVHLGVCTVESSFCLLEGDSVKSLVRVLGEADPAACEASLDAILTLIDGELLQNGCKVLDEAGAMLPIIKILNSSSSDLQEKALGALQRIFRLLEFKVKYGGSAQMSLVDITQRGSCVAKSLAAQILVQLNVLHEQSSFF